MPTSKYFFGISGRMFVYPLRSKKKLVNTGSLSSISTESLVIGLEFSIPSFFTNAVVNSISVRRLLPKMMSSVLFAVFISRSQTLLYCCADCVFEAYFPFSSARYVAACSFCPYAPILLMPSLLLPNCGRFQRL